MAKLSLTTYWRSSSSYRVRIALAYKKLAYESVLVNLLAGEQSAPANVANNPMGHVPTLFIDGVPYVESVAIMELLEELYPYPPLLPTSARDRALVRGLVQTVNAGIQPLQNLSVLDKVGGDDQEKRGAWMKFFISRGLGAFEALASEKGPFAFGEAFTMADVCLVPQLYNARRFDLPLDAFPGLLRADAAAAAIPAFAAAHPDRVRP